MNPLALVLLFQPIPNPTLTFSGSAAVGADTGTATVNTNMRDTTAVLCAKGFDAHFCATVDQLHETIGRRWPHSGVPALAILGGPAADNQAAAAWLRGRHPDVAIVMMDTLPGWPASLQNSFWSLYEGGWLLAGPCGKQVSLTTGERAFMLTLFMAPDAQATHDSLLAAVDTGYGSAALACGHRRLSVLVNRLRTKCRRQGVVLPLKSVHNRGYMFVGARSLASDLEKAYANYDTDVSINRRF